MAAFNVMAKGLTLLRQRGCFMLASFVAVLALVGSSVSAVERQKSAGTVASSGLSIAPADTDIYIGGMNLLKQWKKFEATQLYRDVLENRLVQSIVTRAKGEWEAKEGQVGQVRRAVQDPNVMSLLEMGADMFTEEVFLFADGRLSELVIQVNELADEVNNLVSSDDSDGEDIKEFFMSLPKSEVDELQIPLVVQGFKVSDLDRVLDKIDQLEGLLRLGLGSIPEAAPFAEGLERVEDTRGTRLAWTIDSEMIPWELFADSDGSDPDVMEKIQDLVDGRQFCFTIGLLDSYIVIALSESSEDVSELGGSESLLTHADMKPVKDLASQVVTGISYVSDTYADANFQANFQDFFTKNSRTILLELEKSIEGDFLETLEELPEDLAWLDQAIGDLVPDFRGQTAVSYLTENGSESVIYNRTENVVFDSLKPLTVLNHVGNDPIVFLSVRLQDHPEYFATSREIFQRMKVYIEAFLESDYANEDQREKGAFVMENGWPLLTELADIWEEKFLPAMRDGQHAFVLQAGNLENKQWWKDMPPSNEPLPLPELATVTGITSKEGMIEAYDSLFKWFDRVLVVIRKSDPDAVPAGYEIPRPVESKAAGGVQFTYPIPADCPVPESMAPHAFFTENFMVSSFSTKQTQSLITMQKSNIANPLLNSESPKASAAYINLGRLSQLALPWIVYGFESQGTPLDTVVAPEEGPMPEVKAQDLVDLWKTLKNLGELASSTVAGEEGGTVTKAQFSMPMHSGKK
ncbi:MAG: hypothetical protein NTW52_02440 [Planctomycetota bacterium]|nr:hypothetical protein [Planctomycetota bacterium]